MMCCIADLETVLSKKEAELRGKYQKNEGVKSAKKTKGILVVVRK
jgi:uncharacterized protein YjcR